MRDFGAGEDPRKNAELCYLLRFFSKPQVEQWQSVPDQMEPVFVGLGEMEFATNKPIRLLTAVLVDHLIGYPAANAKTKELLEELRLLLHDWILESVNTRVFSKRETPEELDLVWRIVGRLSAAALEGLSACKNQEKNISPQDFITKYSMPLDVKSWGNLPIL